MADPSRLAEYVARWNLHPDGAPLVTATSELLPVRWNGEPAMLKIALESEERRGASLMVWWDGSGAARVFALDGDAVLLERALGSGSLARLVVEGRDDDACAVLCSVAARLHAGRRMPLPALVPLEHWFEPLERDARTHGGVITWAAEAARKLLKRQRDVVPLHGDLHHGNVLDAGARGWLAVDPKALLGERAFDFANLFRNPDLQSAARPGALARRASVVAEAAELDRERLLWWVLSYAGLSATWLLAEGGDPRPDLRVAELAAAELALGGLDPRSGPQ